MIDKWRKNEIEMISSPEIIEEFVEVVRNFKIEMPQEMIEEWKNLILKNSILIGSSSKIDLVKDDPDDNKFIEAAIDGKANLIVSQDRHLLNLKEYDGIKIVKPEEAIRLLKQVSDKY